MLYIWDVVSAVGEVKATSRALGNIFDRSRTPTDAWYGGIDGIDPEKIGKRPPKRCYLAIKKPPKTIAFCNKCHLSHICDIWQMTLWSQSFCLLLFWFVFVRFVLQLNWGRVSDFSSGGRGPRMGCESVLGCTVRQTSSKYRVYSISRYLWYLWHIYDVSSWYFYYMFYLLHRFMIYLSDQSIQKKAAKNGDHSPGLIAYRPSVFIWRFQMISWRGMGSKNWCIFTKLYIVTLGKRTWVERPGWNMFPKCILPSVRWLMVQVCLFFEANACSNHSWIRGFLRCISPLWISKDSKWSMTL